MTEAQVAVRDGPGGKGYWDDVERSMRNGATIRQAHRMATAFWLSGISEVDPMSILNRRVDAPVSRPLILLS